MLGRSESKLGGKLHSLLIGVGVSINFELEFWVGVASCLSSHRFYDSGKVWKANINTKQAGREGGS